MLLMYGVQNYVEFYPGIPVWLYPFIIIGYIIALALSLALLLEIIMFLTEVIKELFNGGETVIYERKPSWPLFYHQKIVTRKPPAPPKDLPEKT